MIKHKKVTIPTYEPGEAETLPMFFEKRNYQGASGKVYPIPYTSKISDEKIDKEYDGYILENKYVSILLLPEIGGKIHSILDKKNNYDIIYNNKVIKPAMVGLAGPWVSGGVEFNWPQHHRPTTFIPTEAKQVGDTVYMGEIDNFYQMHGTVGISIKENASYVKGHAIVYNSTPYTRRFMWWANTAVEINDKYAVDFPPDVNHVMDHDRRSNFPWPKPNTTYKSVRPWTYSKGEDIHFTSNIIAPSSFMIAKDKSHYNFVCGYDYGKKAGVVMVADHHISPGKKLWIWGNSPFGRKWNENLTDDGSEYCEIMTGVYTDNQPDFTMIEPYEMKEFDQYWYPIREIGEPKVADICGAMNLEKKTDEVFLGIHMTSTYKNCLINVYEDGKIVFNECIDLSADEPYIRHLNKELKYEHLSIELLDCNNKPLLIYVTKQVNFDFTKPRPAALRPKDIKTNEELYLNGYHLYQYNHFTYKPEDYYLEGLRRDPTDLRCNEGMGDVCLDKADFKGAKQYFTNAIEKQCLRNANPKDGGIYYKRGLVNRLLGLDDEAIDDFSHATWQYASKSASYYALAGYASKSGNVDEAIKLINQSLDTNRKNPIALYILSIMTNNEKYVNEALGMDPLLLATNSSKRAVLLGNELINFGLYDEALNMFEKCDKSPLTIYYEAYIHHIKGEEDKAQALISVGDNYDDKYCFPNTLDDIKVLEYANSGKSNYFLGCLLYSKDQYKRAANCFEKCIKLCPNYGPAYRNLSLAYFDHLNKKKQAYQLMQTAFKLMPNEGRILYELAQIETNLNLPIKQRIMLFEKNKELTLSRDDTLLKYDIYLTLLGKLKEAKKILENHNFHTYEGGEGNLTSHHSLLCLLLGMEQEKKGKVKQAIKWYEKGLEFPLNYHETNTLHADESALNYFLAEAYVKLGKSKKAKEYYDNATSSRAFPNPFFYFASLAYERKGENELATKKLDELKYDVISRYENVDLDTYFGVGAPSRLPFAYDHERANRLHVLEEELFLNKGKGYNTSKIVKEIQDIDCGDTYVLLFEALK